MSSPTAVKSSGVLSFSLDDIIKAVLNADGSVSRVYEYDDGGWELEDLDDERVATSEGDSVLITRYDDGQTDRVEIYSPADFLFVDPDPSVPGVILFRSARVRFDGGDDDDDFEGSDEDDDFDCGDGDDRVFGYDGDDAIVGGRGHDDLYGDGGDDSIYGDSGDDSLSGGSNNDMLEGGFGDDVLIGDFGKDQMRGGRDQDLFVFNDQQTRLLAKGVTSSLTFAGERISLISSQSMRSPAAVIRPLHSWAPTLSAVWLENFAIRMGFFRLISMVTDVPISRCNCWDSLCLRPPV